MCDIGAAPPYLELSQVPNPLPLSSMSAPNATISNHDSSVASNSTSASTWYSRVIALQGIRVSNTKGMTITVMLAGISFLDTMGASILIAALFYTAQDVDLLEGLILWPAPIYALMAGLTLIISAVADVLGA